MARTAKLTTTVSTKGQVILPKAIRDHQDWTVGTRLVVEETPDGVMLRRATLFPQTKAADLFGSLKTTRQAPSLEEMDAAVLAEARRHARD